MSTSDSIPKPTMATDWTSSRIGAAQLDDPSLKVIIRSLQASIRPSWQEISGHNSQTKTFWRMWDRLLLDSNVLYRTWYEGEECRRQIVVPDSQRSEVLRYFHDIPSAGHLGAEKMLNKVRQTFYWPGMKADVEKYCTTCDACASRKPSKPPKAPLGEAKVYGPMERIAVDIYGPLPRTDSNNAFILVICDCFTKWTEAIALPNQEAITVTKAFVDHFVSRFGVPLTIHSDLGSNFTSKLFSDMCDLLQIHPTKSTAQHPQANGVVERFNRTLGSMLSMYCNKNQRNWDEFLQQVMMAYRSSIHASTGQTPNKMTLGRDVVLPLQALIGLPPQSNEQMDQQSYASYVQSLHEELEKIHLVARKALHTKSQYQKRHYDLRAKKRVLSVGDGVWVHDSTKRLGVCTKLASQWHGPYLVTKRIDDLVYLVKRSLKTPAKAIHIDRLVRYRGSHVPAWFHKALPVE